MSRAHSPFADLWNIVQLQFRLALDIAEAMAPDPNNLPMHAGSFLARTGQLGSG